MADDQPIDIDGFLGAATTAWKHAFEQKYSKEWSDCLELNRLCHQAVKDLQVHVEDVQELLTANLFIRCLDHYQATLISISHGLRASGEASVRHLLEALFTLRANARDQEFFRRYIWKGQQDRLRTIDNILELGPAFSLDVSSEELTAIRDQIESDLRTAGIASLLTVREIARSAGLEHLYLTAYSAHSPAVHSNVREIENYLVVNADNKVIGLRCGPDDAEAKGILQSLVYWMLLSLGTLATVFHMTLPKNETDATAKVDQHLREVERKYQERKSDLKGRTFR